MLPVQHRLAAAGVHLPRLAADVRFVHFDFAVERPAVVALHRQTNPMVHEPCGLLGNAERPRQFVARNAVLAVHNLPDGQEPRFEGDWGVLEDGSDLDRELPLRMLLSALKPALLCEVPRIRLVADRAGYNPVRPAHLDHVGMAAVRVGKEFDGLLECFWGFESSSHEKIRAKRPCLVNYIIIVPRETVPGFSHPVAAMNSSRVNGSCDCRCSRKKANAARCVVSSAI